MMFKRKTESYKSLCKMILDAAQQFDDTDSKRKIEKLNVVVAFFKKY